MTNKMAYVIGNLKFVHILTVFLELLRMIHANIIQINGTILMTPFLGHPVYSQFTRNSKPLGFQAQIRGLWSNRVTV